MKMRLFLAATLGVLALSQSSYGALPSMDFLKRGGMHCLDGKNACVKHPSICTNKIIFSECVKHCLENRRVDAKTPKIKEALSQCEEMVDTMRKDYPARYKTLFPTKTEKVGKKMSDKFNSLFD